MRKIPVLIEFNEESVDFDEAGQAVECISTRETIASRLVKQLDKVGLEYSVDESSAIPLFQDHRQLQKFSAAGFTEAVPKRGAWVLPATIDASKISACKKGKVKEVWPCSKDVLHRKGMRMRIAIRASLENSFLRWADALQEGSAPTNCTRTSVQSSCSAKQAAHRSVFRTSRIGPTSAGLVRYLRTGHDIGTAGLEALPNGRYGTNRDSLIQQ